MMDDLKPRPFCGAVGNQLKIKMELRFWSVMKNSIYLEDSHDGWIINLVEGGIEIISPGVGQLEIQQLCLNTVLVVERRTVEKSEP